MKQQILILVGEDHSPATHAVSRAGWLKIAQTLASKEPKETNVLRMLEESTKRAKQRDLRGYSGVIGFDDANIVSNAYRNILKKILNSFGHEYLEERQAIQSALLQYTEEHQANAREIVNEMDLRELLGFFGENNTLLQAWLNKQPESARKSMVQEFCETALLNLSLSEREIVDILKKWDKFSLSDKLYRIASSSIDGKASVRQRENPGWATQIRAAGNTPDTVVVFVGMSHLHSTSGLSDPKESIMLPGLEELLTKDPGPFQKIYVANNKRPVSSSLTPSKSTGGTPDETSSEEYSESSEEESSSELSFLDSEDDGDSKNEEKAIKQILENIKEIKVAAEISSTASSAPKI